MGAELKSEIIFERINNNTPPVRFKDHIYTDST